MKEEQRWLLFILLSLGILFGWQALVMPPAPPRTQPSGTSTSAKDDHLPITAVTDQKHIKAEPTVDVDAAKITTTNTTFSTIEVGNSAGYNAGIRGNQITYWRIPNYKVSLAKNAAAVDLCTDQPAPCIEFGFVGLGAPATVQTPSGSESLLRVTWPVRGGAFIADLAELANSRLTVSFYAEGQPQGIRFEPYLQLNNTLAPDKSDYVFTGLRFRRAGEMESIRGKDLQPEHIWDGKFDWAMWDSKYFGRAVLMPDKEVKIRVTSRKDPNDAARGSASMRISPAPILTNATSSVATVEFQIFGGPKELNLLRRVGRELQGSIDFGWTAFIAQPLLSLIHLFYNILGNYGWAIILLTIVIKFALYPLTKSSFRSMNAMTKLRPKIEELQKKFKGDPQRLNQEMLLLYRSEKVNPLGGCLPMLLQIPIFFALYNMLLVSIELRHAPWILWINDLAGAEDFFSIPLMGFELPIRLLPLVMGATMVLQQKMTPAALDPIQQKVLMLMPILFTVMFYGFPSGLVLYWLVNNIVTIGQQKWIQRQMNAGKA